MSIKIEQFKDKPFRLVFNPNQVVADIATVAALTKDNLILSVGKKSCHIFAVDNTGSIAARTIKTIESEGTGCLTIDREVFSQAVKNRKSDVELTFDGSAMHIKVLRGKLKAEIKTIPVVAEKVQQVNELLSIALNTEASEMDKVQQDQLWGTIEHAAITDVMYGAELNRLVESKGGTLTVTSFDNLHMARCRSKIKGLPEFRMGLNDTYVGHLRKIMGDSGIKVVMSSSFFLAHSESGLLYMPPRQVQDSEWTTVNEFLNNKVKYPLTLKTTAGRMLAVLDNLCAVYEQSASIECAATKGGLSMKIATSYGSASDLMPCEELEGKGGFNIEPMTIKNVLELLPPADIIELRVDPGNHYRISCETVAADYLGSMHASE